MIKNNIQKELINKSFSTHLWRYIQLTAVTARSFSRWKDQPKKNISIKLKNDSDQLQWFNYNHQSFDQPANILKTVLIFASFTVSINDPRAIKIHAIYRCYFFFLRSARISRYHSLKFNLDFYSRRFSRHAMVFFCWKKKVNKCFEWKKKRICSSWFMKDCLNCQRIRWIWLMTF